MEIEGAGASRAGRDARSNEDAYLVDEGLGLYVVCDGLSQRPAGAVAANLAVEALEEFVERAGRQFGESLQREIASRSFAGRALRYAMVSVIQAAESDPDLTGMTTTVTMLLTQRRTGVVAHVGDSRAFVVRDGHIQQLTSDHAWTEVLSAEESGRWTGEVDTFSLDLVPGDTVLLCSDGAASVVDDADVAGRARVLTPRLLADHIISKARQSDPSQDATVVVVRVRGGGEESWLSLSHVPRLTGFGHTLPAVS